MPSPAENEAVVRRWLMDEHTHNPYCAVAKHQPCDCDATRQAPARAALAALRTQAEAGAGAGEQARQWFEEHFPGEDDDPGSMTLTEMMQAIFRWGDGAWHTAGLEAERADKANDRFVKAHEEGEQARESLRAVERIVTEDGRVSAYESADHLCNGKCPDMDDMKIRDPDCLPCVVMDFPAALTGEGTK